MAGEREIDKFVQQKWFKDVQNGVFVDVGAAGPEYLSISHRFRQAGWKIVAIEPNPHFCRMYRDCGYDVHEYACAEKDEDGVKFYVVDSNSAAYEGGAVTFESGSALGLMYNPGGGSINIIEVPVRRLDTILQEKEPSIQTIDILSVDVEGYELSVLRGFSMDKYRPKVVILENLGNDPTYRAIMAFRGYKLFAQLEPNEIYIPA